MPVSITDPFGNEVKACSISTMVKAKFGKDAFESEAAWSKHVKNDAYNVLRAKALNGEIPKNTVIGRTPLGHKMVYKGDNTIELSVKGEKAVITHTFDSFEKTFGYGAHDWDFGPNMVSMVESAKAVVNTPAKLEKFLMEDPAGMQIDVGDLVAVAKQGSQKVPYEIKYEGTDSVGGKLEPVYTLKGKSGSPMTWSQTDLNYLNESPNWEIEYKVGQVPAETPVAQGLPVPSTSNSVGALTNEDAAAMFVKTKDKLAQEAGLNIKGASAKLDDLVYKTIADQAGYTPAEMVAKVQAYKDSGKKLSALKKKVLPKIGNSTKVATEKAVNNATAAVKKEEIKPEEVPQVWDSEAVAKAYVKAKDHVVANNEHGWTLYTQKNAAFDKAVLEEMQKTLGPIKQETADTAVADYIANHQKLSVLKKQMVKNGELTKQADTLKGGKKAGAGAEEPVAKPAPKETGAGQVGSHSADPKIVDPKHQLTADQEHQIFLAWEGLNLPLSSSGAKIYAEAKNLANQYHLGDDVLPILQAVDKGKTAKFGLSPEQNKKLYEKKAVEHLKNPQPAGYTAPKPQTVPDATYGELPEDSSLFRDISAHQMQDVWARGMRTPTRPQQHGIRVYTGSTYREINGHLRKGGSINGNTYARQIQDSMSPLPEHILSRRGTSLHGLGMTSYEELVGSVGKTFVEPGFSSTAVGGSGQFGGQVNLIIQSPKGTLATWAKPYSNIPGENELILAARTEFEIMKVEVTTGPYGDKRTIVHVRVVKQEKI